MCIHFLVSHATEQGCRLQLAWWQAMISQAEAIGCVASSHDSAQVCRSSLLFMWVRAIALPYMQAQSVSMQSIQPQGCSPLRPSYVADLRGHNLRGNTTLAPADNNTTRKAGTFSLRPRNDCLPIRSVEPREGRGLPGNLSTGLDRT